MKGSPEHIASYHHHNFPSPIKSSSEFKGSFLHLENIQEDSPVSFPSPPPTPPKLFPAEPETPQEPLEFLSRSWSISAIEISKARAAAAAAAGGGGGAAAPAALQDDSSTTISSSHESTLEGAPFVFAPSMTSQMVMDRIMEHSLFTTPRRNSHSSGPLICHNSGILAASPPPSPKQFLDEHLHHQSTAASKAHQLRGRSSVGRWFKDMKERKKELSRAHNAQVHAAVSMAGVAAAVAAVAAATAAASSSASPSLEDPSSSSKTSIAVASAASLVAAQCVDLAESLGADHEHVSHVVSSAVNVRTAGDIMTLTAAAATALRGAATLKARTLKDARNHATVTPYDKHALHFNSSDLASEDGDAESYTQEILLRGCEFLKRSKKGELHWRTVSVYSDPSSGQVFVKVQGKHMGLRKKRKGIVLEVDPNIPAWPGRSLLDNGEQRHYFGLKTATGVLEFECKSEYEHRLWTQGVAHLLTLSKQHSLALTTTPPTTKRP